MTLIRAHIRLARPRGAERRTTSLQLVLLLSALTVLVALLAPGSRAAAPTLFLAPSGNDADPCTSSQPCLTLQRAFSVARAGDVVELAGGTYPGSTISGDRGGTVAFQPAAGASVTLSGNVWLADAHHVTLSGFRVSASDQWPILVRGCSSDIRLENLSAVRFGIISARDVTMQGGDIGGYNSGEDGGVTGLDDGCGLSPPVQNVVIDGVHIHDIFYKVPQSQWGSAHPDCIEFNGGVDNVTVRNSTIERCGNSFVMETPDLTGPTTNLVFEGNTFRDLSDDTYFGIQFDDTGHPYKCSGVVFRNNSYYPNNPNAAEPYAPIRTTCSGSTPTQVTGNVFQKGPRPGDCATFTSPPFNSVWSGNTFELGNACGSGSSPPPPPPGAQPQCSDGKDNDGDGKVDFPADPGCANAQDNDETDPLPPPPGVKPQCSDGKDNDGDGKVDFPADPGCVSPQDHDERDPAPPPPGVKPQCSDGKDNDGDGKVDFPADPGCANAQDNDEEDPAPSGTAPPAGSSKQPATPTKRTAASPLRAVAFGVSTHVPRPAQELGVRLRFTFAKGPVARAGVHFWCKARIGTTALRPIARSFQPGNGSCRWRLPRGTTGQTVMGWLTVGYRDATISKSFGMRIR